MKVKFLSLALTIGVLGFAGDATMAQPMTAEQMAAEKARLEAEKALLDAQLNLLTSQKNLDSALNPPAPTAAQEAAAAKAQFDALKAQYDAAKAASDAQTAASKSEVEAVFGTVPKTELSGGVTTKTDAGKGEATLLSAMAVSTAAGKIAKKVQSHITGRELIVYAGAARVDFQNYRLFSLRNQLLSKALDGAGRNMKAVDTEYAEAMRDQTSGPVAVTEMPALAAAGSLIQGFSNLGSFFRSEYEIGGLSLTPDDGLLRTAVIRELKAIDGSKVIDPTTFLPDAGGTTDLITQLDQLQQLAEKGPGDIQRAERRAKDLRELAGKKETTPADKEKFLAIATAYDAAAASWKAALEQLKAFQTELAAADAQGKVFALKVMDEKYLYDKLNSNNAMLLFLKVNNLVGGYYSKKNLWSFLGSMPFSVMGGAVVTFELIDGKTGLVAASGELPIHSGYMKINEVRAAVKVP